MILNIQFLRALSVLSVIFFHLKLLPGGFLGVDIFFLISGFLMAKITLEYLGASKDFIQFIKKFYWKRFKRIFPLLLFIIFLTTIIFYFILIPPNLVELSYSSLFSLFFLSNFYFYFEGLRYFAEINSIKPLLHTWSLSVEFLFYLIFPFFLYKKKNFINLVFFIFFLSFFLCVYASYNHTSINFYSPATRLWQFLLGTLIYINQSRLKKFFNFNSYNYISFFILIFSLVFYNENNHHPGILTIIPLICSSVIILNHNNSQIQSFFNFKIFQIIGKISYSLYLNHYILIVIFNIYSIKFDNIIICVIFFLILFIFSFFTFYFIENNFRYTKSNNVIKKFIILFFLLLTIILNLIFINKKGFPERFENIYHKNYFAYPWTILEDKEGKCFHRNTPCVFNNNQSIDIYFFGSSISVGVMSFLKNNKIFSEFNWSMYSGDRISIKNDFEKIFKKKNNKIFILDTYYLSSTNKLDAVLDTLENKKEFNIILIYPYLNFPKGINKIIYHNKHGAFFNLQNEKLTSENKVLLKKDYLKENSEIFTKLDNLNSGNILRIYPHKIFCENIECKPVNSDRILFVDRMHMSMEGSLLFSEKLIFFLNSIKK